MFTKLIRTDEHYQAAINRIDQIFDSPAGTPEGDEHPGRRRTRFAPTPSRGVRSRTQPSLDHTVEATLVVARPLRKAQETDDRRARWRKQRHRPGYAGAAAGRRRILPFLRSKRGTRSAATQGVHTTAQQHHAKNTSPPKSNVTKNLHKISQMNYTRYQLRHFARQMRNEPTDAEHTLWQHLYIPSPLMGEG